MSPDCDCPGACDLDDGASGGNEGFDGYFFLRADHGAIAHDAYVHFAYDAFTIKDQFLLLNAGGVTLFDSGCISGSGYTNLFVAAGTVKLRVIVGGPCDPGEAGETTTWTFSISCAEIRCP